MPKQTEKKRLLWLGDAVCSSGFATVTHGILEELKKTWDISVIGINYYGDPHTYDYKIYPARPNETYDIYGVKRAAEIIPLLKPDIICAVNDPWILKEFAPILDKSGVPYVFYTLADAVYLQSKFVTPLNNAKHIIAYTSFAETQLKNAGLTVPITVIPHGVDTELFKKKPKSAARKEFNLADDLYIVGAINRNQPRKRLDLTFRYFAEWVKNKPENIKLYYHGALKDMGWDILDLAAMFGITDRLIITHPQLSTQHGIPKKMLPYVYSTFDVQVSTTLGEGFGLTTAEGMACCVPQIVPDYSALGDWGRKEDGTDTMHYVPCTDIAISTDCLNTIGGIVDRVGFIEALERLYTDTRYREELAERGNTHVRHKRFNWSIIAKQFDTVLTTAL